MSPLTLFTIGDVKIGHRVENGRWLAGSDEVEGAGIDLQWPVPLSATLEVAHHLLLMPEPFFISVGQKKENSHFLNERWPRAKIPVVTHQIAIARVVGGGVGKNNSLIDVEKSEQNFM